MSLWTDISKFCYSRKYLDFADDWLGYRVEGKWDEISCGGNTSKATWFNNPRFLLVVQERCLVFISESQSDPRGKSEGGIVPIGYVCATLSYIKRFSIVNRIFTSDSISAH